MEQRDNHSPRTTRDALIAELLGDLGAVHDEIKALPKNLGESLRGSLELIASSVEDAEKTAEKLSKETESNIQSAFKIHQENLAAETRVAFKEVLENVVGNEIKKTDKIAKNLQETLERFPSLIGGHYRRLCYFLVAALVIVTVVAGGSALALYQSSKAWEQRSVELFKIIQAQQAAKP